MEGGGAAEVAWGEFLRNAVEVEQVQDLVEVWGMKRAQEQVAQGGGGPLGAKVGMDMEVGAAVVKEVAHIEAVAYVDFSPREPFGRGESSFILPAAAALCFSLLFSIHPVIFMTTQTLYYWNTCLKVIVNCFVMMTRRCLKFKSERIGTLGMKKGAHIKNQ